MPNKKLALEWLDFARKDLETAILLNKENHYTDVIAIDIQQTVEKSLKAVYAFNGDKIPRIHSLDILFNYTTEYINWINIEIKSIVMVSDYYQSERYPGPKYFMPSRDEINNSLNFAQNILKQVERYVN